MRNDELVELFFLLLLEFNSLLFYAVQKKKMINNSLEYVLFHIFFVQFSNIFIVFTSYAMRLLSDPSKATKIFLNCKCWYIVISLQLGDVFLLDCCLKFVLFVSIVELPNQGKLSYETVFLMWPKIIIFLKKISKWLNWDEEE